MTTTAALKLLKQSLSSEADIVTPTSENYRESLARWSAAAERPAGIVVFPTTVEDVSKCVLFAQENKLELAVKGGGHATSGSSSTDGGLCIDLGKMRAITVDVEKKTVTAQGGALWSDVDVAAGVHKLACVGGTVNHTGIGGLSLGGGYGHLTGQYGLVVDNMLAVEYVLADGSIVVASATQNTDLFWAARGAGINFGVATSFTYQAYDQPNEIWGGVLIFSKSELESVINFANQAIISKTQNHLLVVGITTPPHLGFPVVLVAVSYNGPVEEAQAFFDPLLALNNIVSNVKSMPYDQINTIINEGLGAGMRRNMKGSAFKIPIPITQVDAIFADFEAFRAKVPDAIGSIVVLEFIPFDKVLEVKQTDTAFASRGSYGNILFAPAWLDSQFDDACREWAREMGKKCKEEFTLRSNGEDGVGEYSNYDSMNTAGDILFGVNYPRLQELKKLYDPSNVFCKGPDLLA